MALDKSTYTPSIISKLKSDSEYGFLYLTLFRSYYMAIEIGHRCRLWKKRKVLGVEVDSIAQFQ